MDWIKKNYEKLLLAGFGLFALGTGAVLSMNAFSGTDESTTKIIENEKFGEVKSQEVQKTLTDLAGSNSKAVWTSVKLGEHRFARLFSASPVVEKAGAPDAVIAILDDTAAPIRDGVPNWWLYANGLDLTRDDILSLDTDSDKFTNKEEFEGKSNPKDPDSRPPFYAKLVLAEVVEIPYQIRFSTIIGEDIQAKRLLPLTAAGVAPGKLDYKVGNTLFEDDKRFTIEKVEDRETTVNGQKQMVKHLILKDSLNPAKPVIIAEKSTVNLPTYQAKIRSSLSGAEDTKPEGGEIVLPDFPGIKMSILKVTPANAESSPPTAGSVEIEYAEPGKDKGKFQLQLTK